MVFHTLLFIIAVVATLMVVTSMSHQFDYARRLRRYNGYYVYEYGTDQQYIVLSAAFNKSGTNTHVKIVACTRSTDWFSLLCLSPKLKKITVCEFTIHPTSNAQQLALHLAAACVDHGSKFLTQFNSKKRVGFRVYDISGENMLTAFTLKSDAGEHGSSPCR